MTNNNNKINIGRERERLIGNTVRRLSGGPALDNKVTDVIAGVQNIPIAVLEGNVLVPAVDLEVVAKR